MNIVFSKTELLILFHLHNTVEGFCDLFPVRAVDVGGATKIEKKLFPKALSFLLDAKLIGSAGVTDPKQHQLDSFWLTFEGENLVRRMLIGAKIPSVLPETIELLFNGIGTRGEPFVTFDHAALFFSERVSEL